MSVFERGNLIPVVKFKEHVEAGEFIDYDGYGYPVKDGEVDKGVCIYPSEVDKIPKGVTHVLWFNR